MFVEYRILPVESGSKKTEAPRNSLLLHGLKVFTRVSGTDYTLSFGIKSERYATPINNTITERRDFVSNTPVPAFREQKVIVKNSRIFVLPLDIRSAVKNCSSSARG